MREEILRRKAVYQLSWYKRNRDRICAERRAKYAAATNWKERAAARVESSRLYNVKRKSIYRRLVDSLKDNPCVDCGLRFPPECMDFDHVRGIKLFQIGQMGHRRPDALLEEIEKCDVVCANCHRIRTRKREQYFGKRKIKVQVVV